MQYFWLPKTKFFRFKHQKELKYSKYNVLIKLEQIKTIYLRSTSIL
jgi:hypothetical protein